jgi:putative transposase
LQSTLALTLSRQECVALVEREAGADVALCTQAHVLRLSHASRSFRPSRPSAEEVALTQRIDALDTPFPFYGSRRIMAPLRREGRAVDRKAVQRHMREMGIAGICPGPNLSRRVHGEHGSPYLLRDLTCTSPNQMWGIDVTSIPLPTSWMSLVAVLDWRSRDVVSWERDDTLQLPFVLRAAQRALAQATPAIWNSEHGSHVTSAHERDLSLGAGVQIRMDGTGQALDTVFVERLWRAVNEQSRLRRSLPRPLPAHRKRERASRALLTCSHHERPHQALAHRTPAEGLFPSSNSGSASSSEP